MTDLKVGDTVRLIGDPWQDFGMIGEFKTVTRVEYDSYYKEDVAWFKEDKLGSFALRPGDSYEKVEAEPAIPQGSSYVSPPKVPEHPYVINEFSESALQQLKEAVATAEINVTAPNGNPVEDELKKALSKTYRVTVTLEAISLRAAVDDVTSRVSGVKSIEAEEWEL